VAAQTASLAAAALQAASLVGLVGVALQAGSLVRVALQVGSLVPFQQVSLLALLALQVACLAVPASPAAWLPAVLPSQAASTAQQGVSPLSAWA
jgi:hypothetical protein